MSIFGGFEHLRKFNALGTTLWIYDAKVPVAAEHFEAEGAKGARTRMVVG